MWKRFVNVFGWMLTKAYRSSVMMFGLILGTTLGGNITSIGASANAVTVSSKNGEHVYFFEFAKIGPPLKLAAVTSAPLFIWLVWR